MFVAFAKSDRKESCQEKIIGTFNCRLGMLDVVVPLTTRLKKSLRPNSGAGEEIREAAEGKRLIFILNVDTGEEKSMFLGQWQDALNADTFGQDWREQFERASKFL
tara:strand:+ start:52327 stop:52644 length:318 start_codon:yes stop_codon:yes gene_type:complete